MLKLRDYQQEAIDRTYKYWSSGEGENPLIVAPTGAGKSLIIGQLIRDACEFPDVRILMLTHVKELLIQNATELSEMYPDADIGFYSAGLGKRQLHNQIIFAGIQSIWQKAALISPPPDIVMIDEAHMLPKKATTRYARFIADLREINPQTKILGLTATPYRLDSGLLHKGDGAVFDGISYDIPIDKLIGDGYLAPLVAKQPRKVIDLSGVKKRGGEYIESQLAAAASDPALVEAAVAEIVEHGATRKSWLIFASGVAHAELLREEFKNHDIESVIITGGTAKKQRQEDIARFKAGEIRCLINVNVLTTGFNAPAVDLVALVRATMSTALYVQMVGRGTRTAPDKTDCLVLDYGGNVAQHGLIDQIIPHKQAGGGDKREAPVKICPECDEFNPTAVRFCVGCGFEFPIPKLTHAPAAYEGAMMASQLTEVWLDVNAVEYGLHKKPNKPDSVKVTYYTGGGPIHEWLCPEHGGYARAKYEQRMRELRATAYTAKAALDESESWARPSRIMVRPNGKYKNITKLDYTGPEPEIRPDVLSLLGFG